jgi:hypothetical protein
VAAIEHRVQTADPVGATSERERRRGVHGDPGRSTGRAQVRPGLSRSSPGGPLPVPCTSSSWSACSFDRRASLLLTADPWRISGPHFMNSPCKHSSLFLCSKS